MSSQCTQGAIANGLQKKLARDERRDGDDLSQRGIEQTNMLCIKGVSKLLSKEGFSPSSPLTEFEERYSEAARKIRSDFIRPDETIELCAALPALKRQGNNVRNAEAIIVSVLDDHSTKVEAKKRLSDLATLLSLVTGVAKRTDDQISRARTVGHHLRSNSQFFALGLSFEVNYEIAICKSWGSEEERAAFFDSMQYTMPWSMCVKALAAASDADRIRLGSMTHPAPEQLTEQMLRGVTKEWADQLKNTGCICVDLKQARWTEINSFLLVLKGKRIGKAHIPNTERKERNQSIKPAGQAGALEPEPIAASSGVKVSAKRKATRPTPRGSDNEVPHTEGGSVESITFVSSEKQCSAEGHCDVDLDCDVVVANALSKIRGVLTQLADSDVGHSNLAKAADLIAQVLEDWNHAT